VGGGVDKSVEITMASPVEAKLCLTMLGPLSLYRDGVAVQLPRSRKVRALLAYLALAAQGTSRSQLCDLLWDAPSDPRGELRWSLSRLRSVVNDAGHNRVGTEGEFITLDVTDCRVDVLDVHAAIERGVAQVELRELRSLARLFAGEFLEGLHMDEHPMFTQWLGAQRRRLHESQAAILGEIVRRAPDADDRLGHLEQWLRIAPFEHQVHELLLEMLVRHGRLLEAEAHLSATMHLFELEGLDWMSIREAWRAARGRERASAARIESAAPPARVALASRSAGTRRASICVMPFLEETPEGPKRSGLGDGLADDVITRLSKLRVLFVIARGTVFALGDRQLDAGEAARILNVEYVASGSIRRRAGVLVLKVELAETQRPRVVWADEFECRQGAALRSIDDVGNSIVAAISEEIETAERNRAILKPPSSLDAWEAYHRGLWHIYRFSRVDNDQAEHFFRMSVNLDPTFARAHAGLSFVHFQNAFLHRVVERELHADRALESAGCSLMADDRDPAAHWAMGRALWLRGSEGESLIELETSVDLSPNYALGHYTLGFVRSQSGDAQAAIGAVDHSRHLSPFDPLLFAMLACRALAQLRLGDFDNATGWALKAAARPNAHVHVLAIAALCLAAVGRLQEAHAYAERIHRTSPQYGVADFLGAFRFAPELHALFSRTAGSAGLR